MIEGVEEFRAELEALRFRQGKLLAQGPVENILSRPNQAISWSIAEDEGIVRQHGERVDVEPASGSALSAGQVAIPELIGARDALRARVGGIIVLI